VDIREFIFTTAEQWLKKTKHRSTYEHLLHWFWISHDARYTANYVGLRGVDIPRDSLELISSQREDCIKRRRSMVDELDTWPHARSRGR